MEVERAVLDGGGSMRWYVPPQQYVLSFVCVSSLFFCWFDSDTLRKRAWPKLVGLHGIISTEGTEESSVRRSGRSRIPRPKPPAVKVDGDFMNQLDDTTKKPEIVRPDKSDRITECLDSDQIDRDVGTSIHVKNLSSLL